MRNKDKKVCAALNYVKHLLVLASKITGFVSIFAFASLLGTHIGVARSALGLEICALTAEIKKYKSIIKSKKRGKIILLAKIKLNKIEVLIAMASTYSYISQNEFSLVNNVLR